MQLREVRMRKCKSCGELKSPECRADLYCIKCDKIQGEVMAGLKAELLGT